MIDCVHLVYILVFHIHLLRYEISALNDKFHITSCDRKPVKVECPSASDRILVMDASFYETRTLCSKTSDPPPIPPDPLPENLKKIRHSLLQEINNRCATLSKCEFDMDVERPNVWRPGIMYIKYMCNSKPVTKHYCNEVVTDDQGFIMTAGYPSYYTSKNCSWFIKAKRGQFVQLVLYDQNIREARNGVCMDMLMIHDELGQIYSGCGGIPYVISVTSQSEQMHVEMISEGDLILYDRGILLQYSIIGCESLLSPIGVNIISQNSSHIAFRCRSHVYSSAPETLHYLVCIDNSWNSSFDQFCDYTSIANKSSLIDQTSEVSVRDITTIPHTTNLWLPSSDRTEAHSTSDYAVHVHHVQFDDTVLIASILVILLIANAVVIVVICWCRRGVTTTSRIQNTSNGNGYYEYML